MPNEKMIEVYRAQRDSQTRYTYFLLTAVGAAIALTINQTHELPLTESQIPLGLAVLCWGLSFIFGCMHLRYTSVILGANGELLQVQAGTHALAGTDPAKIAYGSERLREIIEKNNNRSSNFSNLQFRLLILGAIFYITWHVFEMWLRTPSL